MKHGLGIKWGGLAVHRKSCWFSFKLCEVRSGISSDRHKKQKNPVICCLFLDQSYSLRLITRSANYVNKSVILIPFSLTKVWIFQDRYPFLFFSPLTRQLSTAVREVIYPDPACLWLVGSFLTSLPICKVSTHAEYVLWSGPLKLVQRPL